MKQKAFVIMPFAPEYNEIYNLFIAEALTDAGFDVFRADDIKSNQNILHDIVSSIISADLIIADLTESNPNVYYELGLAHASKKNVILLTQNIEELPFDLRSYRVISYDTHFATINIAREELITLAKGAIDGSVPFGSPITDFASTNSNIILSQQDSKPLGNEGEEKDDLGFIDYMVNLEEGFTEMASVIIKIGEETNKLTDNTIKITKEMDMASGNPHQGSAKRMQQFVRVYASQVKKYSTSVGKANSHYTQSLNHTGDSLEYIIRFQDTHNNDNQKQLNKLLEELKFVEKQATSGRDSFLGMAETMEKIPSIERQLNQSIRVAIKEVRLFVENIDQTISMISRARGIGNRFLEHKE